MRVLDSRRLTGRNIHASEPGAVAWIRFEGGESPEAAVARWRDALDQGLTKLGWSGEIHARLGQSADGKPAATLMFTASPDRLYAATELNEWAIATANGESEDLQAVARSAESEQATMARGVALIQSARKRGLPALIDDDQVSVGYGTRSQTWPLADAPTATEVDWDSLGRVPIALVTGTNGKTTTSRILARMGREAGLCVGNSSTDGICLDGVVLEEGDWTGTGAARELLRRGDVELAVLEVARGGLLRRGLEVEGCDAAIITNLERDHLGEEGINDLADMATLKGVVPQAVAPTGTLVLGADSPDLVDWARKAANETNLEWFSTDPEHLVLREHVRAGGTVWTVSGGRFIRRSTNDDVIMGVDEVPLTFNGHAVHNVANVLGAMAVANALGLERGAIVQALRSFGADPHDNPGRTTIWELPEGPKLITDFAHNQAGLEAMTNFLGALRRKIVVSFAMAGDRSDAELVALGAALFRLEPRLVVLREQREYLRGREPGEVPHLLAQGLRSAGMSEEAIIFADDEVDSLQRARAAADPDDLIVLLVHSQRDAVERWAHGIGAKASQRL